MALGRDSLSFLTSSIKGFGTKTDPFLIEHGYVQDFEFTPSGAADPSSGAIPEVWHGKKYYGGDGRDYGFEEYSYLNPRSQTASPEAFKQVYGQLPASNYDELYELYSQSWNMMYSPGSLDYSKLGEGGQEFLQGGWINKHRKVPLYKDVEKVVKWFEVTEQQYKGQRDAWEKTYGKWLAPGGSTRFASQEEEGKEIRKQTLLGGE